jgi:hypothetical protein
VPQFHAALGKTVAVPIDRGAGIVAPNLDQILLQVAGSVHRHGANEFELVDLGSLLFLIAGIHGGQVVANAGAGRESINADHLGPLFGCCGNGKHTAGTATDHENFRLDRIDDVFFSDFRRLAEPVAVVGLFGLGDNFNGNFTLCLSNALGGGLVNGLRGDAGAGNGVDVSRLSLQNELFQLLGCSLTDVGSFVRNVKHDVRDLIGVKGHRDDNVADAGSFCRIGTGLIDARGSGVKTDGRKRRTACNTGTQESTTRKDFLVHVVFSSGFVFPEAFLTPRGCGEFSS